MLDGSVGGGVIEGAAAVFVGCGSVGGVTAPEGTCIGAAGGGGESDTGLGVLTAGILGATPIK